MATIYGYRTFKEGTKPKPDDIQVEVQVYSYPYNQAAEEEEAKQIGQYFLWQHVKDLRDKYNNSSNQE